MKATTHSPASLTTTTRPTWQSILPAVACALAVLPNTGFFVLSFTPIELTAPVIVLMVASAIAGALLGSIVLIRGKGSLRPVSKALAVIAVAIPIVVTMICLALWIADFNGIIKRVIID